MKRIALLLPLVLGFAAGLAAAQDVGYNFDQGTDFSKFKSYKWVDIKSVQQVDYVATRQITSRSMPPQPFLAVPVCCRRRRLFSHVQGIHYCSHRQLKSTELVLAAGWPTH